MEKQLMNEEFDEYFGMLVFSVGVLLMGIGAWCKRWFSGNS